MNPIANPSDFNFYDGLYHFYFGAYGSVGLYVWADSLDSALDEACDWLADNAPGIFHFFDKADYLAACETGAERAAIKLLYSSCPADAIELFADQINAITERAEADFMSIGHTTYPQFDTAPFLASWEWSVREVA